LGGGDGGSEQRLGAQGTPWEKIRGVVVEARARGGCR
jgi:hypothetical protein